MLVLMAAAIVVPTRDERARSGRWGVEEGGTPRLEVERRAVAKVRGRRTGASWMIPWGMCTCLTAWAGRACPPAPASSPSRLRARPHVLPVAQTRRTSEEQPACRRCESSDQGSQSKHRRATKTAVAGSAWAETHAAGRQKKANPTGSSTSTTTSASKTAAEESKAEADSTVEAGLTCWARETVGSALGSDPCRRCRARRLLYILCRCRTLQDPRRGRIGCI